MPTPPGERVCPPLARLGPGATERHRHHVSSRGAVTPEPVRLMDRDAHTRPEGGTAHAHHGHAAISTGIAPPVTSARPGRGCAHESRTQREAPFRSAPPAARRASSPLLILSDLEEKSHLLPEPKETTSAVRADYSALHSTSHGPCNNHCRACGLHDASTLPSQHRGGSAGT